MSEELETLIKGKVITSLAANGAYRLAVYDKEKAPTHFLFMGSDKEYKYDEYCNLLRDLWENYLGKGEVPKLLDLPIPDEGLIQETLHCIAPRAWGFPSATPLLESRESLLYWLKGKSKEIQAKLSKEHFDYLNRSLEDIIITHLSAKKKK